MSATGRGGKRRKDDFYETPPWAIKPMLPYVQAWFDPTIGNPPKRVLEPGCGTGNVIRELIAAGADPKKIVGVDIRDDAVEAVSQLGVRTYQADFLDFPEKPVFDLVIGNPPYIHALDFLKKAMKMVVPNGRIAFLLRLNWLASSWTDPPQGQRRPQWLMNRVPNVYVIPVRPSFTGGSTDACEYAWMTWGVSGQTMGRITYLKCKGLEPDG